MKIQTQNKYLLEENKKEGEVNKMVLNHMKKFVDEIREHPQAHQIPEPVWDDIEDIENWEICSSEDGLQSLANFNPQDGGLQQLLEEVYDEGISIGELYEFSEKVSENPEKTPVKGPFFKIEINGRPVSVYPVWERWDDQYALVIESEDQYVGAEILILKEKEIGEVDIGEAIIESLRGYVEGE